MRRIAAGPVPFDWRVGVDNCFGWLASDSSDVRLVEPRLFFSDRALVVDLAAGGAYVMPADRSMTFVPVPAPEACAAVGIPAPRVEGGGAMQRRLDPFHVERHRSALFGSLVELIRERRLPCGYSLRAVMRAGWDGHFRNASLEDAELLAAGAVERGAQLQARQAVRSELASDVPDIDPARFEVLLRRSGWLAALDELEDLVAEHQARIDERCAAITGSEAL